MSTTETEDWNLGEVVVHVGQAKAASTSLQRALAAGRPWLKRQGINYPGSERDNHAADVARFVLDNADLRTDSRPAIARHIKRLAAQGDWDSLQRSTSEYPLTIISAEILARFDRRLAGAFVKALTRSSHGPLRIVLIARPASRLLPALYAQTALDWALPSFETWVRMTLRDLVTVSDGVATESRSALDARWLASTWGSFAQVTSVDLDPPTGVAFEGDLLEALKLHGTFTPPFLEHTNRSLCAARLIAWQQVITRQGRPDNPDHFGTRPPFGPFEDGELPGFGGRLQLTDTAARVVDASFPRLSESGHPGADDSCASARAEMYRMIRSPQSLTCVAGVDDEELAVGVEYCARHLPWSSTAQRRRVR